MDDINKLSGILSDISVKFNELSRLFENLSKSIDLRDFDILTDNDVSCEQSIIDSIDAIENEMSDPEEADPLEYADNKIVDYLKGRGFTVKNNKDFNSMPEAWMTLAEFIAEKFDNVKPFILQIRQHQGDRSPIRMNLNNCSQQQISDITNLMHRAYNLGLLPSCDYKNRFLCCAPPSAPESINFFTGDWLEMHVFSICRNLVNSLPGSNDYSIMNGIRILKDDNNDQMELDLCILTPDNRLVWIEAKSGSDYTGMLTKYNRTRKQLNVHESNALLVNPVFNRDDPDIRSKEYIAKMTFCSVKDLEGILKEIFNSSVMIAES